MTEQALEYITVEPSKKADACVIWLHGLGADGHDFADITPSLNLPPDHGIRFIFPHAPSMPVSLNANMVMPAWFDIYSVDFHGKVDEQGIAQAERALSQLIEKQILEGIASNKIILIGFSQGGALALHAALRYPKPLAGVAGLSTYLPIHESLKDLKSTANNQVPIFLAHGIVDTIVPYWMGQQSCSTLEEAGYKPTWHSYPIAHTVCMPECHELGHWIDRVLYG